MRRLSGHAHAQPSVLPRPDGSALSRRAIMLPSGVQLPAKIQQPLDVVPSSRSCANELSCWPFFTTTAPVAGSIRSASALPLLSIATSSEAGSYGLV
ncbi:Uncharacterised protein [Salmonella enterica subsp. enterica serovar Bovismorbificans]|uniref:Uncharacterized protein n=1 Tax=Salmonella enterica subsp. enterica serovar Bovismorbificans TaxID=58097 RepID=A0A655BZ21_SALET|nr:Uncharacterised protein [Salmonella enterica subsp. enterica serovar Bovismorbificans]